ncbi:hypothetical protein SPRG_06815 [Saprolegnia parasitica CBS 223.65]|uniref:Sulfatase-modifying factor enzyme-like domain-containing protein n=1 Tax=Saprolegnia parasitica (strain CBS 223.65) TaxID=695850 RepID=A0A067CL61_SAPPC|nr:hypothetical protein SPRG_06815 [Saprolegnia parasitica CBS 223.65]KDO27547.1 hypothetical protein SPRG_06815 [Saprolegnia parasitica CBS 223.65]|eukprot:XP_012201673.1 hypothetical protein SPRG_06815 [Saprolegnia parasitica CBS 223.65]
MLSITSFPRRFATSNKRHFARALSTVSTSTRPLGHHQKAPKELPRRDRAQHVHVRARQNTKDEVAITIEAAAGIQPEVEWYTTTPRTPFNDPTFPGLLDDGRLHSVAMTNLSTCTRQDVLDYLDNTWALTDMLFSSFQNEEAFIVPPPHGLRHPMAFYYGHPTCFYVNKLRLAGLLQGPVNPAFEDLFEVGVDEMRWDDMSKNEKEWPSLHDMQAYRRQVYGLVKSIVLSHPELEDGHAPITPTSQTWALFMAMEHDRIHLETSSMLMQEHDVDNFLKPALFPAYHESAAHVRSKVPVENIDYPVNPMVAVAGGAVHLGKDASYPSFGWDNEYGAKDVVVGPFRASSQLVSNGEFWQFVKDSGYLNPSHWTTTGWAWRSYRNTKWPAFWRPDGPQGSHEYKLRAIFDEISMQWNWPAQVNLHEAHAYCKWKQAKDAAPDEVYHLLTEPMHHLLREQHERANDRSDAILELPATMTMATASGRNTNVAFASFTPVDAHPANSNGFHDVFGNAWEWCEDRMSPLPGFEIHPVYDDFTVPCFDGEHHVIMGGSYMSSGDNGGSKFARYHFRPHFFQHAGFRVAASPVDAANDSYELVTSCLNAPEPHAKPQPYRTSNSKPLRLGATSPRASHSTNCP